MKILMINVSCGTGSTGRICTDLAQALEAQGHEVKIAYGRDAVPLQYQRFAVRVDSDWGVKLHGINARLWDCSGFGSRIATEKFIRWVKEFDPDIIHLHNLHGYYIHVGILFRYLRTCGKRIIWTLHDCWPFTGHCTYFDYAGCKRWKTSCSQCPQRGEYPVSLCLDFSRQRYREKRELFTGIADMVIVTPSQWLADLVKQSFLREYPTLVIHNGIDTTVFQPTRSDIKMRLGCADKRIVLGVAALWNRRKGLDAFVELSQMLPPEFQIVLVGLSRAQINNLPKNIIGVEATSSVHELVQFYSAAEIFVNPTQEDNYPTTNLEAISCGTPVITYETGGSPESAVLYGACVPKGDVAAIARLVQEAPTFVRAQQSVDKAAALEEYLKLYCF